MATEPTPPVAPSTITGPFLGARPFSSMRMTAKAAVKPAVPSAIASQAVMPGGNACSQSAASTPSPGLKRESLEDTTVPARSTPPMH